MKSLIYTLFLVNWERKLLSFVLSIIIWFSVNQSQTASKVLEQVSVRVVNIPTGTTVEGLQSNGILSKKISLSLQGKKGHLSEITSNDIEVVLDATDKFGEWAATVSRKNLVSLNPDLEISKIISRINPTRLSVQLTPMLTDKIPITVQRPIGEPPADYQFLDIWPYQLFLTVSGPEQIVKKLKAEGLSLTFNLSNISRSDFDALQFAESKGDEVCFYIPDEWKKVSVPALSDTPLEIDDPQAYHLHIDFLRSQIYPVGKMLPISLFYPQEYRMILNPETLVFEENSLIEGFHGLHFIREPLFAKGVSRLFAELIQDKLEVSIFLAPKSEKNFLDWSLQFINPRQLEDKYVSILMNDASEEGIDPYFSKKKEEYLRNRFRKYMHRLKLCRETESPFDLKVHLQGNKILVEDSSDL